MMARLKQDESGMTLIELVVACMAGSVVFFGLTMMVVAAMHDTTRVSHRVHATQNARVVLAEVVNELHSSCVAQYESPIYEGSTGTKLRFFHATGAAVSPAPTFSEITLVGTTLVQTDYETTGTSPAWVPKSTATSSRALITEVGTPSGTTPIFSYYKFNEGKIETPAIKGAGTGEALTKVQAEEVSKVGMTIKATPPGTTFTDNRAAAQLQDSAVLRFTAPSYQTTATNLPCE